MSILSTKLVRSVYQLSDGRKLTCAELKLKGRIEASSIDTMQKAVLPLCDKEKLHVVLNLFDVDYTTSTGLGAFIKYHNLIKRKGGHISLLVPPKGDVRQVIELLGINELMPVFHSEEDLKTRYLDLYRGLNQVKPSDQQKLAMVRAEAGAQVDGGMNKDPNSSSKVILAADEKHFFFDVLMDDLKEKGFEVDFADNAKLAWQYVKKDRSAVIVVDYALTGYEDLCMSIKNQAETSACSIIRVFPAGKSPEKVPYISIIPNEHVVEPCSLEQLTAFIASEVARHKDESHYYLHELYFGFPTNIDQIEKANDLIERVMTVAFREGGSKILNFIASVREAIDNAKRHGNQGDEDKQIRVLYLRDKDKVTVTVQDEGEGFDYRVYLENASTKNIAELADTRPIEKPGGLGIALMRKATNKMSYNDRGNELTLVLTLEELKEEEKKD